MIARPALTKCNRDGCETQTANTFCGRECNRLAHCGPGTRAQRQPLTFGHGEATAQTVDADAPTGVTRAEYRHMAAYTMARSPMDSAGARKVRNIRKRRQEREALTAKRRASRKKR